MIQNVYGTSYRIVDLLSYKGEEKYTSRKLYEDFCAQNDFIFQFTSDVSLEKINNFIASKSKRLTRIHGRLCAVKEISHSVYNDFCDKHHIQGKTVSKFRYGLFYGEELVGAIGFIRYEDGYNLNRLVFGNFAISGGASKLLSAFRKDHPEKIVSFSNNGYSNGNVYRQLGFVKKSETKTDLWYVSPAGELINRRMLQKKRMPLILPVFDINKTEFENAFDNGYKVWHGPGHIGWVLPSILPIVQNSKFTSLSSKKLQTKRVLDGTHHILSDEHREKNRIHANELVVMGECNLNKTRTCNVCGFCGKGAVMTRWHFTNCGKSRTVWNDGVKNFTVYEGEDVKPNWTRGMRPRI